MLDGRMLYILYHNYIYVYIIYKYITYYLIRYHNFKTKYVIITKSVLSAFILETSPFFHKYCNWNVCKIVELSF